jgi:glycosyltransferase involved in cell wall biosynthesis
MSIAQDIYPEVMLAHGMLQKRTWLDRWLSRLFAWAYRRAAAVISLGPVMTERLLAKGVHAGRVVEICNWATGDETVCRGPANVLRSAWNLSGHSVLLYSGNLGIAHDVETPIRAMQILRSRVPDMVLVFVGKGSRLAEARALTEELGLGDVVRFRDFVPFELLPHSIGLADAALVTLRTGFEGLVVPSKLLGYMARSIPTLYVGPDSDIARYVQASRGGECVSSGDVEAFVAAVEAWMTNPELQRAAGANASSYYRRHLSREAGLRAYRAAVDRAAFSNARA